MPHTPFPRMPFLLLATSACLALAGCGGGGEKAGNNIEMHDMEVVDGTINDSMTDLDAVKADGVGNVNNAGSVSHATEPKSAQNGGEADTETVPEE